MLVQCHGLDEIEPIFVEFYIVENVNFVWIVLFQKYSAKHYETNLELRLNAMISFKLFTKVNVVGLPHNQLRVDMYDLE